MFWYELAKTLHVFVSFPKRTMFLGKRYYLEISGLILGYGILLQDSIAKK